MRKTYRNDSPANSRLRWVLFTYPGIGQFGPWVGVVDVDLIELGQRVMDA